MADDPTLAGLISEGSITRIKLSIATKEEIVKAQPTNEFPVSHPCQLLGNPSLGLPLEVGSCESCGATEIDKCEGHFGFIVLPVPVYHPSHIAELRKVLSMICFNCLQLKNNKKSTGKESNFTSCSYCQDLPPLRVAEVKKSNGSRSLELRAPARKELGEGFWSFLDQFGFRTKGSSHRRTLLPKEAQNIMMKISGETRRRLAVRGYIPQEGFVMGYFPVPPNCLRAFNVLDDSAFMCSSDTSTNLLRKILRKILEIKGSRLGSPNFQAHEVEADDLQIAIADYIKLRGTGKGPRDISFTNQAAPKQWQQKMKSLFISKSSSFSCRGVITGDPYIAVNVVGVPHEVARKMSVEERVTDHNIAQLQDMVDRGLCLTYRDANSITYSLDVDQANKKRTILNVGETVNRRVLDGDVVFLNRPPSTDKHSVQALYVHVHNDHTMKINPLICGPLGADFDGDCVQIFFPRSVSARAEATELFTAEKQLVSSHNGKLNFQLKNDCLLALKIMSGRSFSRREANQLTNAMFTSGMIPQKRLSGGPYWTFTQILEALLPDNLGKEFFEEDLDKELVGALVAGTATLPSILSVKGPREAIKFLNVLQPLLMESLLIDGFSISLRDFNVPSPMLKTIQNSSLQLDMCREPIVDFIAHFSDLGLLVDPKNDIAVNKVVEQLGFLDRQLQCNGRLYSSSLVEDCLSKSLNKCCRRTNGNHPLEAHGVVMSSFYHGLNPYEELLHSISAREKIIRASKGLVEPGNLFKNMMAILRDVIACYDGTVRNSCGSLVVHFDSTYASTSVTPGGPVGILAATAVANAAYKAVLDPNQNNMTSWDSMKEVLLTRASSRADKNDRKAILYLNKCSCGIEFCMERAALAIQTYLKRIKVEDCATEFSIKYQQQTTQATHCLVGHIHLDKKRLDQMKISMGDILKKCQEVIGEHGKKKGQMSKILKRVALISSECLGYQDPDDEIPFQVSCLQFFLTESITTEISESSRQVVHLMTNTISPILLDTIIKGDPRVQEANITWVEPQATCWVQNSGAEQKGELALEITVEKASTGESGDAWGAAMDACIPVIDLIDTTRSVPYGIQQVRQVFGISSAYDRVTQHLSKAVGMITKSVLKEHLTTVASSMTCTGDLHGFNSYGYKATFQSLKVQAPFMEATLSRATQSFEKAAEKVYSDQLDSVVSTCSWGNHTAIGTGSAFEIYWNDENLSARNGNLGGYGVYDFFAAVGTAEATQDKTIVPHSSCCLYDVDNLQEDEVKEDDVLCLGVKAPISWTDKTKADDYLLHDLDGSSTAAHSTGQERQRRQAMSNWNSAANWQNDQRSAAVAGSTSTGGWNNSSSIGRVYQRRQPKSNWSSDAARQDGKPSCNRANVTGAQNFAMNAGSSSSGGWNRKTGNLGRGGGRTSNLGRGGGRTSNLGRGGGRAVLKSEGSHRGGSNSRNWRAQKKNSAKQGGNASFTPVEQQVQAQVEPIMKNVKRIIRESRDGIKLSPDDEMFIVRNILMYHPEKEKKMAGQDNYIMVAKHEVFPSRCLYVVSSDGSRSDFSYKKCLENFIKIHYPDAANSFCRKYFK